MKFDPYEYIGVIVPGSVLVLALALVFPQLVPSIATSLTLGDLGLMVILAFVAGHFVQAGGNLWESLIWKLLGGMPTGTALQDSSTLLNEDQKTRLKEKITQDFGDKASQSLTSGRGSIRELTVHIRQHGSIDRIEKFNRNYGMMRGVAVAFFLSAAVVFGFETGQWKIIVLLCFVALVFTYRMVRFAKHYAREIFVEYLRTPVAEHAE